MLDLVFEWTQVGVHDSSRTTEIFPKLTQIIGSTQIRR